MLPQNASFGCSGCACSFLCFAAFFFFMASVPIGSHCALMMPGGGRAARNLLPGPLRISFIVVKNIIAGWLKVVASQLCTLSWLFSWRYKLLALDKMHIFDTFCLQRCALYSRCTVIVYLTNLVSCMSVLRWLWSWDGRLVKIFSEWCWALLGKW